jgi:hypothetical protein
MSTRIAIRNAARNAAWLLTLVCSLTLAPAASAQQQLAAVQGTVMDSSKAFLPGVTISVTNLDTGATRTTTTNDAGVYRVPSLEPGRYEVSAELANFRKAVQSGVTLSVGATLGVNFTLETGVVTETVDVQAVAPDIQTERAEISAVVERRKIVDLPLVGRNVLALAALQPGVNGVPTSADFLAAEQGLGITANGQRESANSSMVDGMSINNGPWGGTVLIVPNAEAVQEFQVIANNPNAEYGRNSGAMVSVITKGGTNTTNGSAFVFRRDQALRAKNIFERTKPDFARNDFGVSFGGPLRRDKTFYFVSYEGVRETTANGAVYTVETQQFVDFVQQTRPNSNAARLLNAYKLPMYPTEGLRDLGSPARGVNVIGPPDGIPDVGTINFAIEGRREGDQVNGRVDQMLRGGRDRLRLTYYITRLETEFNYIRSEFNHPYPFRNQLFTAGYSSVLSNQTLNEFGFGYVRQHGEAADPTPEAPTIGITGLSGSTGFGVEFWHPITFTQNNFEIRDTLTLNRGRHSFRMGGDLRLGRDFAVLHHWERPNYNFVNILDFADDEPNREQRAVDPATGLPTVGEGKYVTNEWGLYIQDNWKPAANLTLTMGLRYENFGNPGKAKGSFNGIELGQGATRQEQMLNARAATIDRLYSTDWNNFGPRLGVSWDPTSAGTMVFRGGAGVSYNRINNTVYSDERLNPPQFASAVATFQDNIPLVYSLGPNYPANPALGRGLDERGGIRGARVDLRVVDPDATTPMSYNWFAGVQRVLPGRFVAEASYIGSSGRHLMAADGPVGEDYNRFAGDLLDGVRNRINPSFGEIALNESSIDSNYHGLALQVNRRYDRGFAFQASYTLGKLTDRPTRSVEVTQPGFEEGPATLDVRHKLALNVIWRVPYDPASAVLKHTLGGWQVNAITILQTGQPFNVTCSLPYPQCDFNADGLTNDRPNAPSFSDLGSPSIDDYLAGVMKSADFSLPAAGTQGTLGRNVLRGPGYANTDLSIFKNVELPGFVGARQTVQIRIEAFNVFNRAHLANPVGVLNDTLFGRSTSLRGGTSPRVIQLGAKWLF